MNSLWHIEMWLLKMHAAMEIGKHNDRLVFIDRRPNRRPSAAPRKNYPEVRLMVEQSRTAHNKRTRIRGFMSYLISKIAGTTGEGLGKPAASEVGSAEQCTSYTESRAPPSMHSGKWSHRILLSAKWPLRSSVVEERRGSNGYGQGTAFVCGSAFTLLSLYLLQCCLGLSRKSIGR